MKTAYYKPYAMRITEKVRDFIKSEFSCALNYAESIKDRKRIKEIKAELETLEKLRFK